MGSILCPLGHPINLSRPPVEDVHLYFSAEDLDAVIDLLMATADASTAEAGRQLDETGYGFTDATKELMICPTCGSLLMPSEDPPRHYVPEVLTDDEIDAEWRKPPPGWDE